MNNNIFKLFILFTLFNIFNVNKLFTQGINIDTIKINKNNPATIELPDNIIFSLIGNNPYRLIDDFKEYKFYQISVIDNILIIETGNEINKSTSSITIKTSNNTYFGYITYSESVTKSFFSFINFNNRNTENNINNTSITEFKDSTEVFKVKEDNINDDTIIYRINTVMQMPTNIFDIADIKGNVVFQISNIVNDLKHSYINLIIHNNSSSTYSINGVLFKFEEGKKGVFKKKDVINTEWLNTIKIIYPTNKNIESYSFQNIGIVVPLYSGTDGIVLLKVMETTGTRTAVIEIPSKIINTTQVF